jgi:acetyltransferase-like isoleucine patch superfamily enzyme
MINKIFNKLYWLLALEIRYLFKNVVVNGDRHSRVKIGSGGSIKNCRIYIGKNSTLILGNNVLLDNVNLKVNGSIVIGDNCKLYSSEYKKNYIDVTGKMICGNNNRLESNIRVRFDGELVIGDYNNINSYSEIRCDDYIKIGSFNQISYHVMIWDTNTHNIYKADFRRDLTINKSMGFEFEKPKTQSTTIGDDCWIGKEVTLLKGTCIGNKCIIGYGTTLTNESIYDNTTVVVEYRYKKILNSI